MRPDDPQGTIMNTFTSEHLLSDSTTKNYPMVTGGFTGRVPMTHKEQA